MTRSDRLVGAAGTAAVLALTAFVVSSTPGVAGKAVFALLLLLVCLVRPAAAFLLGESRPYGRMFHFIQRTLRGSRRPSG